MKRLFVFLFIMVVLSLIAAQCAPVAVPQPVTVVETVVVKEEVEVILV